MFLLFPPNRLRAGRTPDASRPATATARSRGSLVSRNGGGTAEEKAARQQRSRTPYPQQRNNNATRAEKSLPPVPTRSACADATPIMCAPHLPPKAAARKETLRTSFAKLSPRKRGGAKFTASSPPDRPERKQHTQGNKRNKVCQTPPESEAQKSLPKRVPFVAQRVHGGNTAEHYCGARPLSAPPIAASRKTPPPARETRSSRCRQSYLDVGSPVHRRKESNQRKRNNIWDGCAWAHRYLCTSAQVKLE